MEFDWSPEEVTFRAELRSVIEAELPERWQALIPGEEASSDFTFRFCRTLAEKGLLAPHWPVAYGGRDASPWQFIILGEELWSAGEPRGSQYMNVNWIGPAIIEAGTEEQRLYHLRRIAQGDVTWCQGFSELEAGTDLAKMQTSAIRDGGSPDCAPATRTGWTSPPATAGRSADPRSTRSGTRTPRKPRWTTRR
jgi:alkylation response protein AidB-like acyl-CoA dehydrogenase